MKKPELLIAAASLEEVQRYVEAGADAVVLGEARYGLRLPGDCNAAQIAEAVQGAHPRGARVYVAVNNLMDNDTVALLPDYLAQLAAANVHAILFGDPAVLMAARASAPNLKLHWNAEMTSTNYATAEYWGRRGASRFVLARELNMDQVLEIKRSCKLEVQVQVHGMTNIYHSKRPLVGNYLDHQQSAGVEGALPLAGRTIGSREDGLYLIEVERPDERYPIYEDSNGTHIMSSDDICILESLHELLEVGIDSFSIEPLMKTVEYNETVIRAYRKAIDAYAADPEGYRFEDTWLDPIRALQHPDRELSFGFFYKEQIY
ncbi:peptidase U32 family protein [Paenibacillus sp. GCM10027626]|uniref:peptidase U32 family protein n=1 Tax=Paenibacillus sp. GCM10027626 TaxID=3273411 RepID=UPI00363DDA16